MDEYNKLQIIWDIIRFKLKIKDLKLALKISKIYDEIFMQKNMPKIKHFKFLISIDMNDIMRLIKLHNHYVINSNNRIDLEQMKSVIITVIMKIISQNPILVNTIKHKYDFLKLDEII